MPDSEVRQLRLIQTLEPTDESEFEQPDLLDLILGSRGDRVRALQQQLTEWGFDPGEHNGDFGDKTKEAVVALQEKLEVPATGIFDSATRAAVEADLSKSTGSKLQKTSIVPVTPGAQPAAKGNWSWLWMLLGAGVWYLISRDSGSAPSMAGIDDVTIEDGEEEEKPKRKKKRKAKKKAKKEEPVLEPEVIEPDEVVQAEEEAAEPESEPEHAEEIEDAEVVEETKFEPEPAPKPKRKRKPRKKPEAVEQPPVEPVTAAA